MPTKKTKSAQRKKRAHQKKHRAKKNDREPESTIVEERAAEGGFGSSVPKLAACASVARGMSVAIGIGDPRARNVTVIDARETPALGALALLWMLSERRRARAPIVAGTDSGSNRIEPAFREAEVTEL